MKRFLILLALLFAIQTISYPENQADSIAIAKYQKDSANAKSKIDSLLKADSILKATESNVDAKTYENVFTHGSTYINIISIIICGFLIYLAASSPKNAEQPLGIPAGSIRAIIAILSIVFYILVSLSLSLSTSKSPIPADVTKTLGTLVVAVSAFYFGSKAAEQGVKNATDNINNLLASQNSNIAPAVPVNIIQQAITANKKDWMILYNCTNIALGKKKTMDITQNIDCIVFYVADKGAQQVLGSPPSAITTIPSTIPYITGGKTYNIPTDVQQNP